MACGVRRRAIVAVRMESVEAGMGWGREETTVSGSLHTQAPLVTAKDSLETMRTLLKA